MSHLIDILRFMTVGCLVLIIAKLIWSEIRLYQKLPAAFFTYCALGYLLVDWEPLLDLPIAFYFFLIFAMALPFVFWLFSLSLFNDKFRLRPWMGFILVGVVLIQFIILYLSPPGEESPLIRFLSLIQRALSLFFVVLGIVAAVSGREADLINSRFRFRNYFVFFTAGLIVLTLLSEIAFYGQKVPLLLELFQKGFIAGLTFAFAFQRFDLRPGFFPVLKKENLQEVDAKPEVDQDILNKLTLLMEEKQHWRTEGLTIRQLADTMQVKEYKLRNTINQHLGFRNFNDYLHSYRIKEACKLLSDPEKKDLIILEIAYDLGYHSLAPFNKAFKEITGMTPTEWRRATNS